MGTDRNWCCMCICLCENRQIKANFNLSRHCKSRFVEVKFMWFWWFMLICDLLAPIIMIIAGRMMWKHCPRHINGVVGYRTDRSMKNMDTWKFANEYCGRLWWKTGLLMFVSSVLIHIPFYHSNENRIGIVGLILVTIQVIVLIASIFLTENALKRTFNNDGEHLYNTLR